jgi:hypothetical protein
LGATQFLFLRQCVDMRERSHATVEDYVRSLANDGNPSFSLLNVVDTMNNFKVMALGPALAIKYGSQAMSVLSAEKPEAKGSIVATVSSSVIGA